MESPNSGPDKLTRLTAVQARVRTLAKRHRWFADAIRAAFDDYLRLRERYQAEKYAVHSRQRAAARELLAKGLLNDPQIQDGGPYLLVQFPGLCPAALAKRLAKFGHRQAMLPKLQAAAAAAALAALDRDTIYQSRELPAEKRKAMAAEYAAACKSRQQVQWWWTIYVSRPTDCKEPANPHIWRRANLKRFDDADYFTIALHILGGLADVGALRPIVPEPRETGDHVQDDLADIAWRNRFPVAYKDRTKDHPPLSVRVLPPSIAEQLLADMKVWARDQAASRGESLTGSVPSASHSPPDRPQYAAEEVDDADYRPATWFPKGMAPRLRMAARKDRRTKRVSTRKIDGVVCYSVAQARQWWPRDVPTESK